MDVKRMATIFWANIFKKKSSPQIDKVEFLKTIPFFQNLSSWDLMAISEIIHERDYEKNEYLFEIDQPGAALFIIKSGKVSIEIPGANGDPMQVALLESGTFVGELALLDQSPRSASARALQPTQCLALFRNDLNDMMESHPNIAGHIYRSLASVIGERLREMTANFKLENQEAA